MIVYGLESIASVLDESGYEFKLLANDNGVVLFPRNMQHRDAGQPGIKYDDESRGNALAAMVRPGRIELRFHKQFSDDRVRTLMRRIISLPELDFAKSFAVTYQGRTLISN
jgi:hypothetical protein